MNTKADILRDNLVKLQDILNSQESIAEKIGVLQVELFNNPDKELEVQLDQLATTVGNAYIQITEISEQYRQKHQISEEA